jgi:hypothetical protein
MISLRAMGSPVRRIVREQLIQPARARPSRQPTLPFGHPIARLAELDRVGGSHGTHYLASDLERPAGTWNRAILRQCLGVAGDLASDGGRFSEPLLANNAHLKPDEGNGRDGKLWSSSPGPAYGGDALRPVSLAAPDTWSRPR